MGGAADVLVMAISRNLKRKKVGNLFMREVLKDTLLFEAVKEFATVHFFVDGSDAVDMRVGEVLALQWLSNSDVVNFNVNTQTRIAELSKLNTRTAVLAEVHPTSDHVTTLQSVVVLKHRLTLVPVPSHNEAATFISQLMKLQHKPGLSPVPKRHPPPDPTLLQLVQTVPHVGRVKSELLLSTFNSMSGIAEASLQELKKVIGQPSATAVYEYIHNPH